MWGLNINKIINSGDDVIIICFNVDVYMGRVFLNLNLLIKVQVCI